ncbi:MAG: glycosyltransferase family 4 protein [Verrucomicrobia bacterium]|nr:glycosyltransferase family 4 protein [Verrucomicrobiota bacterium]
MKPGALAPQDEPRSRRLKVLYLISPSGKGMGGHNHSFRTTVQTLGGHLEAVGVTVGTITSPVHAVPGQRVHLLAARSSAFLDRLRIWPELLRLARQEQPDVVHAFDPNSFFFGRRLALALGCAAVLTKCGGPNPAKYFPVPDDLVVFSEEDLGYFRCHRRFQTTRLHLIPNRVRAIEPDPGLLNALSALLPDDGPVLLRIARLGPFHEESVLQTTRLAHRLRQDGHKVRLLLIGFAEHPGTHRRVQQALGPGDCLLTEPPFTVNASRLVDVGDLVVGTGRSLMEAASRGRILLAPIQGGEIPVLLTSENWRHLFRTNFSQRSTIPGYCEDDNYREIRRALAEPAQTEALRRLARSLFEEHFSIESAVPRYLDLYHHALSHRTRRWLDLGRQWLDLFLRQALARRPPPCREAPGE